MTHYNMIQLIRTNRKKLFHASFGEKKHIFIFTQGTEPRLEQCFCTNENGYIKIRKTNMLIR